MQYRQGDVFITSLRERPADAVPVPTDGNQVVLVEGEATGHNHVVPGAGTTLLEPSDPDPTAIWVLVVDAPGGVPLSHPEHATILIPKGVYEVRRQREYDPFRDRFVYD